VPDDGLQALPTHFFVENLLDAKKIAQQLTAERRCDVCRDDDDDDDRTESGEHIATSYCGECMQYLCIQCSRYMYDVVTDFSQSINKSINQAINHLFAHNTSSNEAVRTARTRQAGQIVTRCT